MAMNIEGGQTVADGTAGIDQATQHDCLMLCLGKAHSSISKIDMTACQNPLKWAKDHDETLLRSGLGNSSDIRLHKQSIFTDRWPNVTTASNTDALWCLLVIGEALEEHLNHHEQ